MSKPQYLRQNLDFCLAHIAEECGEVIAAYGKSQRWGLFSVNPELPLEQQETNLSWIRREVRDLKEAIDRFEAITATADLVEKE